MDLSPLKNVQPEIVTDFYGVYLLYNINPQYTGRTYVGYTRNPTRRIMQHNRGAWAGGAYQTNNKGPWKMVLIVHGFPNNIAALRFEWAWQHPEKTRRLLHVKDRRKIHKEKEFEFRLRIVSEMLRTGPWCRLPLTVRWLEQQYFTPFPMDKVPPSHVAIKHGPVKSKNNKKKNGGIPSHRQLCSICYKTIDNEDSQLKCLNTACSLYFHSICLGDLFLNNGEYVPIDGQCPKCGVSMMWGDLVRNMNKRGSAVSCASNGDSSDGEESSPDDPVRPSSDDDDEL